MQSPALTGSIVTALPSVTAATSAPKGGSHGTVIAGSVVGGVVGLGVVISVFLHFFVLRPKKRNEPIRDIGDDRMEAVSPWRLYHSEGSQGRMQRLYVRDIIRWFRLSN